MKNEKFIIAVLFVLILLSFSSLNSGSASNQTKCFPMLWNQGITKKSWVYLEQDEPRFYKKNSDISDGDHLKMPKNSWDATYIDYETRQKFSTPDKTNASFKFVTTGYRIEDQKKEFGFDFMVLNKDKKNEEPIIFRISNNSQKTDSKTTGTVREVGFVFDNWPQYWADEKKWTGGYHSFSGNYQIEKLNNLTVKFKFRLVDFNAPLKKNIIQGKWIGSYATCDLRFTEYDENGKVIKPYLIGIVFSNPLNVDYTDNKDDGILFGNPASKNSQQQILLLHGNKNGVKEINSITPENRFQTVEIDFKPLISKYLNINKKHKNIITGIDIYSATRAVNFTYDIQDIQVTGCTNN